KALRACALSARHSSGWIQPRYYATTTHPSVCSRTKDPRWMDVDMTRESDSADVVIVGGGPAGLAAACKLKQLSNQHKSNYRVVVLEKAPYIGGHTLSGACIEPTALTELFPDWADRGLLFDSDGAVAGVATNDLGIHKDGSPKESFQRGMEFAARQVIFAEGCRGSLTKQVLKKYGLLIHSERQTYGIGLKELWEIKESNWKPGLVEHGIGWPLVTASPRVEFSIVPTDGIAVCNKAGSKCDRQRALEVTSYTDRLKSSPVWHELHKVRNIRPSFHALRCGMLGVMFYTSTLWYLFRGREPWTFNHGLPDNAMLKPASACKPIEYPNPDGVLSFDLPSSVYLTGTYHDDDEPAHLTLLNDTVPETINLPEYDGPEQRYCPAGVYEFVETEKGTHLQINAQNCIHCKTCDIKDPTQNINWVVPQGGEGPSYNG
ncbi:electron-transferring-flavoprotein dehydrogenase, partial [Opisthorchis viverrini]